MTISANNYDEHVKQSQSLQAEGYHHLIAIRMMPPGEAEVLLTFCPQKTVVWQGITWESYAVHINGVTMDSSGEMSRPSLSVVNPHGIFSRYIHAGWMDNAEVTRYQVLKSHVDSNTNSFVKKLWRVAKITALSKTVAVCELRGALDGQFFTLPGRQFYPPEFTTVSM